MLTLYTMPRVGVNDKRWVLCYSCVSIFAETVTQMLLTNTRRVWYIKYGGIRVARTPPTAEKL